MNIHDYIERFQTAFQRGRPKEVEIEYLGTYLRSGDLVTQILTADTKRAWKASIVPDFYIPLYDLKVGEPPVAGGVFSAAPFEPYVHDAPEYEGLYMPVSSEPLFELCTDNCGSAYWLNADLDVFGRNLNNEIQHIGSLESFVAFAIDRVLAGENWYEKINNSSALENFDLKPCEGFD